MLFLPGVSELCITLTIINDTILENDERFFVLLSSSDPDVNLTPAKAVVVISDDDGEIERDCSNVHIHTYSDVMFSNRFLNYGI